VEGDAFVLAAGTHARSLGRKIGIGLPIYPLKGYSVTAPIKEQDGAPIISITDAAEKIAYARIGKNFRLAGAADLVGPSLALDDRRISSLLQAARATFPNAADWSQV